MMKTCLIILFCGLACTLSAQKVRIVQNLRWPEIPKIFIGETVTYELRDDDGNRYTRKIVGIFPERNSILLDELEVPVSEIKRIGIRNHVGWGYFKKARWLLASYAPSSVFIPPSNSPSGSNNNQR